MAPRATKALAVKVIKRLRSAGHEALLAGGCVRDMLMRRRPADYDVATSATPREVKALFRRVRMVGAKFGVAMVIERGRPVEVTTFRSDVSYSDGRRPDAVRFVSAREDARRRDFTINGMFYDPLAGQVVDYVGGRADLARRVVRAIGDPAQRFAEDYLRMLRAVRFAARLGFRLDGATADAIRRKAGRIVAISGERIREELEKMSSRPSAADAFDRMHDLGLAEAILPELFAAPGAWARARGRLGAVAGRQDVVLTLAALLCGLPAGDIRNITRRWGASNAVRGSLVWMAEHLTDWRTLPDGSLADLKRRLAHRDFERLQALWRVEERLATGGGRRCRAIRRRIGAIDPRQIAPPALLTGEDLMRLGLTEGARLGRVQRAVYEAQLNERVSGRRGATDLARRLIADAEPG